MSSEGVKGLRPLVRTSLQSMVARSLRAAIQSGQLRPEQRLFEEEVANQLGVSRVPVREALRALERDGLVVSEPGRGVSVANPTDDDIEEIYDLRIALETYCISLVLEKGTDEELASLQAVVDRMSALGAASADRTPLQELDLAFHEDLVKLSKNRRLLDTWRSLVAQIRMLLALSERSSHDLPDFGQGHQRIIDALRAKDLQVAQAVLRRHIMMSKERLQKGRHRQVELA